MRRILIVDDDKDTLSITQSVLGSQGFEVTSLSDCNDVVKKVNEQQPDLILLDINIGNCDGRQLCLDLKEKHNYKRHILLFSADPSTVSSLGKYKADGIIAKPVDMHTFILTIKEHIPVIF